MEYIPYFEVFRVLVMERNKNLKNIFFYQCIRDAKIRFRVLIFFRSVFQLKKVKILQKFSVRNVPFSLIPFQVLGITGKQTKNDLKQTKKF